MRRTSPSLILLLFIAGLLAALPQSTAAQEDPPGRVARLNFIQGSVSYQVSGDKDWVQADPNRPLTTGDSLWADRNSRGEVHIGSTAIRLSSETGISFLTLDDRTIQLQLAQGTIEVHLRNNPSGDAFEIDTPNLAFTLTRAGEYRIATDPDGGSTVIVVREGEGEVTGGGESYDLRSGQRYTFSGTDQLTYDASGAPGFDDFEDWCQSRDDRENHTAAARYVSRDVDGYYDLDEYGSWEDDADYGTIWVPRGVMAGWAPYHYGHWVWISPWGWTWVDEEPWGFAPFHYGRWCYVRNHWGWVPGPIVVRPVYAPALVGFVGGGGFGFSVSFGSGFAGVAWFPLGPRDVFVPGYRCSPRYVQVVNVTNTRVVNITQVTNVYNTVVINRDVTRVKYTYERENTAITAVSRETFVGARSVSNSSVRVTAEQVNRARVVESAPIAPTRESYVSAAAKVATARPAMAFAQRPVVARLNPAVTVNRRTSEYTNDSRPFSRQQGNQPAPPLVINRRNDNNPPPAQQGIPPNNPAVVPGRITNPNATDVHPPASGNTSQPPSRDGFRPFQPPPGNNTNNTNNSGNANQNDRNQTFNRSGNSSAQPPSSGGQPQNEAQRTMRFTPPVKARDEMYDVHPPLNRKETQPPPKAEERHAEPPKQEERHTEAPRQQTEHKDSEHH